MIVFHSHRILNVYDSCQAGLCCVVRQLHVTLRRKVLCCGKPSPQGLSDALIYKRCDYTPKFFHYTFPPHLSAHAEAKYYNYSFPKIVIVKFMPLCSCSHPLLRDIEVLVIGTEGHACDPHLLRIQASSFPFFHGVGRPSLHSAHNYPYKVLSVALLALHPGKASCSVRQACL